MSARTVYAFYIGYQYLGTIDWRRASWLVASNRAESIVDTSIPLRNGFYLPKVIRLLKAIRRIYRSGVPWSRRNLFVRDDHTCAYCGKKFTATGLTVDHVLPKSRGGRNVWGETVSACKPCNNRKDSRTPSEAGMSFHQHGFRPYTPTVMEFFITLLRQEGLDGVVKELLGLS
jgi:5-methylcytosine-specific restriction endonuclease McrA